MRENLNALKIIELHSEQIDNYPLEFGENLTPYLFRTRDLLNSYGNFVINM